MVDMALQSGMPDGISPKQPHDGPQAQKHRHATISPREAKSNLFDTSLYWKWAANKA
jgi:hypothetical protein